VCSSSSSNSSSLLVDSGPAGHQGLL
jgi:hypothetical protein